MATVKRMVVCRVPKPLGARTQKLIRNMVKYLGWCTVNPWDDAPKLTAMIARFGQNLLYARQLELVERLRERAAELRKSDDMPDLLAAGELEDLASEMEDEVLEDVTHLGKSAV